MTARRVRILVVEDSEDDARLAMRILRQGGFDPQFRRVQEVEALTREARQQANRSLTCRYDEDGSMHLTVCLPAETGALVMKALRLAIPEAANGYVEKPYDPDVSAEAV